MLDSQGADSADEEAAAEAAESTRPDRKAEEQDGAEARPRSAASASASKQASGRSADPLNHAPPERSTEPQGDGSTLGGDL